MKKYFCLFLLLSSSFVLFSQSTEIKKKIDLSGRPSDHFLIQGSSDRWLNLPDSINSHTKNNSRGGNIYFMLDKPFKSNPHFSVAFGAGISTSHLFLNNMNVDINGKTPLLQFTSLDSTSRFKKYSVNTAYVEIPVELRFFAKPANPGKSFKFALGIKIGTLLNAHTKGKTLRDAGGNTINEYTEKISAKSYFNSRRLSATARVGLGNFSLFGSYNLSGSIFKDKVAPEAKLLQLGLTFSGL